MMDFLHVEGPLTRRYALPNRALFAEIAPPERFPGARKSPPKGEVKK
jgi:hypothetical protein